MQRIKNLFTKKRTKSAKRDGLSRLCEDGFIAIKETHADELIKWSEIARIVTFKVDCFAYDVIWLAFERADGGLLYIPEDAEAFTDLMSAMNKAIPGINP